MRNYKVNVFGVLIGIVILMLAGYLFAATGSGRPAEEAEKARELSPQVQMQFMRPGQLEAAARRFPVAYVPFGCIEWHGRHLPLGTDALKAHGILVKCAERFGGAVYPPVYFHSGFAVLYTQLAGSVIKPPAVPAKSPFPEWFQNASPGKNLNRFSPYR